MRVVDGFTGRFLEGCFVGRAWRLFAKPWAWPYARREYGVWCAGVGPVGAMVFGRSLPGERQVVSKHKSVVAEIGAPPEVTQPKGTNHGG